MPSSSTPPPSYYSRSSVKSSSSVPKKHRLSSADKDKEKNNSRDTIAKEKDSAREVVDDAVSIKSRSSSGHSSVTTRTTSSTQSALDSLRAIAGSGVRRAKCRAEFLEELARDPDERAALDHDVAERLRIVTGKEAVTFFRKFFGDEPLEYGLRTEEEEESMKKIMEDPVVFAVCAIEAGRRVVDYYMTWRGKTRAKDLNGSSRRRDLLDDEFRKVRKSLDRSFSRRSSGRDDGDDSRSHRPSKSKKWPSTPSPHKRSSLPPDVIVSSPDAALDLPSPVTPTTRRESSTNDSVISLPFLGAIRNVPLSNRLPLRVTNPDRNSIAESSVVLEDPISKAINTSLETLVEAPEHAENVAVAPDPGRQSSVDTLVSDADQKLGVPKDKSRYAESVSSAGSRSSRSSRSKSHRSRSHKRSSSRKHHELTRSKSERREHGHSSSSRHKHRDDHHHRSSRHRDERDRKDDDDRSGRKSDRKRSSSSRKPLETDIILVVVDPDEVDRDSESIREATTRRPHASNSKTWHNSSLLMHAVKPSPATVNSPWAGPLARESYGVRNIMPNTQDSDEETSTDESGHIPVIPKRNTNSNDSDTDSESQMPSRSSSPRLRSSPPPMEGYAPAQPETQAQYPRANSRASPPANAYTPSAQSTHPLPRGIPVTPQVSPYTYGSPTVNYKGLVSTGQNACNISSPPMGVINPVPSAYTPAFLTAPLIVSPSNSTGSLPATAATYIPGFIPTHISPTGSNTSVPLPNIHHALATDPSLLPQTHSGNSSPYLYATPRGSPGSPYVPAWISPQSTTSGALPGTMTPASIRNIPLHPVVGAAGSGSGPSYVPGARVMAPY